MKYLFCIEAMCEWFLEFWKNNANIKESCHMYEEIIVRHLSYSYLKHLGLGRFVRSRKSEEKKKDSNAFFHRGMVFLSHKPAKQRFTPLFNVSFQVIIIIII